MSKQSSQTLGHKSSSRPNKEAKMKIDKASLLINPKNILRRRKEKYKIWLSKRTCRSQMISLREEIVKMMRRRLILILYLMIRVKLNKKKVQRKNLKITKKTKLIFSKQKRPLKINFSRCLKIRLKKRRKRRRNEKHLIYLSRIKKIEMMNKVKWTGQLLLLRLFLKITENLKSKRLVLN